MTTSAELYRNALTPYMGSAYQALSMIPGQAKFWGQMTPYDKTTFDPSFSVDLMQYYNQKNNLGLTDDQIVAGIKAFADRSAKQWNNPKPLDSSSNPVAVAAESIERALTLAGKDGGAFWGTIVNDLGKGQAMADDLYRYTMAQSGKEFQANEKEDNDFGSFIDKFAPMVFSAIAGPAGGLLATAAKGAGKGEDFGDILKSLGMSAAGTLLGGGGLDSFTNGTALGNWMTGAGDTASAAAGSAGSVSDILGESAGQGFTPSAGLNFTPVSALGSGGIGAGLGGVGVSGLTGALGEAASWLGEGVSAGGGGVLDQLPGVTNTGQMTPIPSVTGGLESITGNATVDALFGQTAGAGASIPGAVGALPGALPDVSAPATTDVPGYSVDPGPDPFATTADVNAGWNELTGYGLNSGYSSGVLDTIVNDLKSYGLSPSNGLKLIKSLIPAGGAATPAAGGTGTGAGAGTAGANQLGALAGLGALLGGGGDEDSAFEQVLAAFASGRSGMDDMARNMAQSGKGALP